LGRVAEVKVIAPVALIDFSSAGKPRFGRRGIPVRRSESEVEIFHPAWLYPPGGFAVNPVLLFLRLLPFVKGLRKRFDFQIIDAHFAFPDGIAAALLSRAIGVPFTVTLRGSEVLHAEYPRRKQLIGWALRRAARIIAVSEGLRQFAVSLGVERSRTAVISNGVDASRFSPQDRNDCRAKYGISLDSKVILSAGTLIELKGHHRIAQALAGLIGRGYQAELLIVGRSGAYEPEIRKTITDLGLKQCVRLLGEVSPAQVAELMSAADVLCLASSREGWPNVVHEAMACGTPVVATDVGAVKDMIPSSEHGIIVPPNDNPALAEALSEALNREWDRTKISTWAQSRTWERVVQEVLSEFEAVLMVPRQARTHENHHMKVAG
jgi:glycosyltransferase involved in cell wall biosynthesis